MSAAPQASSQSGSQRIIVMSRQQGATEDDSTPEADTAIPRQSLAPSLSEDSMPPPAGPAAVSLAAATMARPAWASEPAPSVPAVLAASPFHTLRAGTQRKAARIQATCIALSPDSQFVIAATSAGELCAHGLRTSQPCKTFSGLDGHAVKLAINSSQHHLLAVCRRAQTRIKGAATKAGVAIWNYESGELLSKWMVELVDGAAHVAFLGAQLVAVLSPRTQLRIFDLAARRTVHKKDVQDGLVLSALAGSPDGSLLVYASRDPKHERRGQVGFWHIAEGRLVHAETSAATTVLALGITPDSALAIGLCASGSVQDVALWRVDSGVLLGVRTLSLEPSVDAFSLDACADGHTALVHVNEVMYVVRLQTLAAVRSYFTLSSGNAKTACVSRDGAWLAFLDRSQLQVVPFHQEQPSSAVPPGTVFVDAIACVAVVLRERQHCVSVYDTERQEQLPSGTVGFPSFARFEDYSSQLAIAPDGSKLAYLSMTGGIKIVQLQPAAELTAIDAGSTAPLALAFNGDGSSLWAGHAAGATKYACQTGNQQGTVAHALEGLHRLLVASSEKYLVAHCGGQVVVLRRESDGAYAACYELRDRTHVALSDSGAALISYAAGSNGLHILDLETLCLADPVLFAVRPDSVWALGKIGEVAFCCSRKGDDSSMHVWRGASRSSLVYAAASDAWVAPSVVEERFLLDASVEPRLIGTAAHIPALLRNRTTALDLCMFFVSDACPRWFVELLLEADPRVARAGLRQRPNSIHVPLGAGPDERTYLSAACTLEGASKAVCSEMLGVVLALPLDSFPVLPTRTSLLRAALQIGDIKLIDAVLQRYVLGAEQHNLCAENSKHVGPWCLSSAGLGMSEDLTASVCELLRRFPDRGIRFLKAFGLLQFARIDDEDYQLNLRCPGDKLMVGGCDALSPDDGLLLQLRIAEKERMHRKEAAAMDAGEHGDEDDADADEPSDRLGDMGEVPDSAAVDAVAVEHSAAVASFASDDAVPIRLPALESASAPVQAVAVHYVGLYRAGGVLSNGDTLLAALVRTGEFAAFDSAIAQALVRFHWNAYARRAFISKFFLHAATLVILVAISLLQDTQDRDRFSSSSSRGTKAAVALTFVLIVPLAYSVYHELVQATRGSMLHFQRALGRAVPSTVVFKKDYFTDIWNVLDLVQIVLVLAFILAYLSGSRHYQWILAVLVYAKWAYTVYYLQAFSSTATLVRIIIGVTFSVKWFVAVLLLWILATANAIFVLVHNVADPANNTAFNSIGGAIYSTFVMLLLNNDYGTNTLLLGPYETLLYIIFSASVVFVLIILLNLLIGACLR